MEENQKITKETYTRKKLEQEIGELKGKLAEMEFTVLLLSEQKGELERRISGLESEKESDPTIS